MKRALRIVALLSLFNFIHMPAVQAMDTDPAGECAASHKWPGEISACIKDKMRVSDDALQATYRKLLQDTKRVDSSTDKTHAKMLARKAMSFDAERETSCLQEREEKLRASKSKHSRREGDDHFMACRTIFNHRQIAALGGDISTYQPASAASGKIRASENRAAYND